MIKTKATEAIFTDRCLPYGIFSEKGLNRFRVGVAYKDRIIDLSKMSVLGLFSDIEIPSHLFSQDTLNDFMNQDKSKTNKVRDMLQHYLSKTDGSFTKVFDEITLQQNECELKMPIHIGDYVDFYSSEYHATNVGKLFRSTENALLPNWKHLPIGYHGRSSTIVLSGEKINRPSGQIFNQKLKQPEFKPSEKLDFELELGMVIGQQSQPNQPISIDIAEQHIFGFVLFNDWSARDIQSWEYQPLGPFLGKSFASSISPWVVPIEALIPYQIKSQVQKPSPLPYLKSDDHRAYDIQLEVWLITASGHEEQIVSSNSKYLYWTFIQQLAHYTSNGCNVNTGDVFATGTISGPKQENRGCMLEITENGTVPLLLSNGEKRTFLLDGDTVVMKGKAGTGTTQVSFGNLENKITQSS